MDFVLSLLVTLYYCLNCTLKCYSNLFVRNQKPHPWFRTRNFLSDAILSIAVRIRYIFIYKYVYIHIKNIYIFIFVIYIPIISINFYILFWLGRDTNSGTLLEREFSLNFYLPVYLYLSLSIYSLIYLLYNFIYLSIFLTI